MWKRETGIVSFALLNMNDKIRAFIWLYSIHPIGHNYPCTC